MRLNTATHGALDQLLDDLLFAAVLDRLELDLAAERGHDVGQVADARHDRRPRR